MASWLKQNSIKSATPAFDNAVDVLCTVPLSNVAEAFGTLETSELGQLRESIGGLRATCKDSRELCNALVHGVELTLPDSDADIEQRVLGLKPFKQLQKLKVHSAQESRIRHNNHIEFPSGRLHVFAALWSVHTHARVQSLTLCYWFIDVDIMALVATGMPDLKEVHLLECDIEDGLSLEPLSTCSRLGAMCVSLSGDRKDQPYMEPLQGLASILSLRSLNLSAAYNSMYLLNSHMLWRTSTPSSDYPVLSPQQHITPLLALTQLEQLELPHMEWDDDLQVLVIHALTAMQKLDTPCLSKGDWHALCNGQVKEVVIDWFDATLEDLPLQRIDSLRKVMLSGKRGINEEMGTSVAAIGGMLQALPPSAVVQLEKDFVIMDHIRGKDTATAHDLAVHMEAVLQAVNEGRIIGAPWQSTVWLTGNLSFKDWPRMPGVAAVLIYDSEPLTNNKVSTVIDCETGYDFPARFPDLRDLVLDLCQGDVLGLLQAVQPMGLQSVYVKYYTNPIRRHAILDVGSLWLEPGWQMADVERVMKQA